MIDKKHYNLELEAYSYHENRPLELFLFIDPLCQHCWALEPIIKKLLLEYSQYFSLTYVLTGKLQHLNPLPKKVKRISTSPRPYDHNRPCPHCENVAGQHGITSPFLASIAIKAAELQGRKAGIRFLRKLQEYLFLKGENITDVNILLECAKEVQLDVHEFQNDIHSVSTSNAFQCDIQISNEMGVEEIPSLVLFNNNSEQPGLKVTGVHQYEIYEEVLVEMLGEMPNREELPPLLSFIHHFQLVTTNDIVTVYEWPVSRVEKELKKLLFQQKIEKLVSTHGTFWRVVY
ncbi:ClpXP adapter SpxH family protein [Bacillus kwashiorkori]|uniref:ClpXP adapter SpxH family protein n=1 Tax=Bacillus kwashiorkori TaxID=1522318 RepID=UPI000ABAA5B7|nr:ClpXP adapter SpxH family protein [Bacillus kwashiorkori]